LEEDGAAVYGLASGLALRMDLVAANPRPVATGVDLLPSTTHVYAGADLANWHPDIPHYAAVRYENVYAGIDLFYRSREGQLEYEFRVGPQADPGRIHLNFPHAQCSIGSGGGLVLKTDDDTVRQHRPSAWQQIDGARRPVAVQFELVGCTAGFSLGEYDTRYALVIDPLMTVSFFGGNGWDAAYAVATDAAGNIYLTGETASANFPGTAGSSRANLDVFVTKMAGSAIVYTTILSSSGNDAGRGIAIDGNGNAYVGGIAGASNFPVTAGVIGPTFGGVQDAFVARLDATGHLVFSTYLGGAAADAAYGIALDSAGLIYVAGTTSSPLFPTTPGAAQTKYAGGEDAFIAKLNSTGTSLIYSTLMGGTGNDIASAIAVDAWGNAVIAGSTDSGNLPVRNAWQPAYGGSGDGFFGSLNASGTAWNFLTYIGSFGPDQANAVAVDTAGNSYVTGSTFTGAFAPNAFKIGPRGGYDVFVVKLSPAGTPVFTTLFGGSNTDAGTAIAVDSAGRPWVGGYTMSPDFPVVHPWQLSEQGGFDGFLSWLSADGSSLLASGFLGGGGDDRVWGLALGPTGPIAVGYTSSTSWPTTAGTIQVPANSGYNAFVARVSPANATKVGIFRAGLWQLDLSGTAQWNTATTLSGYFGSSGVIPVVGDWNGSGKTKVGVWRNGLWMLDLSGTAQYNPATTIQGWLGWPGDIPVVGDWDGSGKTKVGIFRNGLWQLDLSGTAQWNPATIIQGVFGQQGDIPVVGDWDGSGKTKVGVWRNGLWILDLSGTAQYSPSMTIQGWLGWPGDKPVVGDWDGSGKTNVGIFRNGVWQLDLSGTAQWNPSTIIQGSFGQLGDIPVVGDWDGSGKTKVGTWRSGLWVLDLSGTAQYSATTTIQGWLGWPGDVPVVGRW
jgi:hypothetical protein